MPMFWFDVANPARRQGECGRPQISIGRHQEQGEFPTRAAAYAYYERLCQPANRIGYFYLCYMGAGPFPDERVSGSKTRNPCRVVGRSYDGQIQRIRPGRDIVMPGSPNAAIAT